jgi:hypothetical protein
MLTLPDNQYQFIPFAVEKRLDKLRAEQDAWQCYQTGEAGQLCVLP